VSDRDDLFHDHVADNDKAPANFIFGPSVFTAGANEFRLPLSAPSLAGVQIWLEKSNGTAVVATTTSDSNGSYTFSDVEPDSFVLVEMNTLGSTVNARLL
jgi:hypothetical protein